MSAEIKKDEKIHFIFIFISRILRRRVHASKNKQAIRLAVPTDARMVGQLPLQTHET